MKFKLLLGLGLLIVGLVLCGGGLWLLLSPTPYRAVVRISVGVDDPSSYDPYFIQSEIAVIRSVLVASNAVNTLNITGTWGRLGASGGNADMAEEIKIVQHDLQVRLLPNSRMLEIAVTDSDPGAAANIANAVADSYREFRIRNFRDQTRAGMLLLQSEFRKNQSALNAELQKLNLLRRELRVPVPDPSDLLLETNYHDYSVQKQKVQKMTETQRQLAESIRDETARTNRSMSDLVRIENHATAPQSENVSKHLVGLILLLSGLPAILVGSVLVKHSGTRSVVPRF